VAGHHIFEHGGGVTTPMGWLGVAEATPWPLGVDCHPKGQIKKKKKKKKKKIWPKKGLALRGGSATPKGQTHYLKKKNGFGPWGWLPPPTGPKGWPLAKQWPLGVVWPPQGPNNFFSLFYFIFDLALGWPIHP
jgi:hypothetical protein